MAGFIKTTSGTVPQVKTVLSFRDHIGTARARIGIARNQYTVNPGLYSVGSPSKESPIFVTANYKLSFDALRKELTEMNAWILVVDTRGINVWCAAGKGTFSADEIALQVQRAGLVNIVSHRELILPQFGATGVASQKLQKMCGFNGVFGPLRAEDIPRFMDNSRKADETMRSVTFTFSERLVLVPVEVMLIWKILALVTAIIFILSGISPEVYSFQSAWTRGLTAVGATITAILTGALAAPALLPWIPGRQFWLKGVIAGAFSGTLYLLTMMAGSGISEKIGIWFWIVGAASYMVMNFTGATPYTSLSGVEKEMRKGLPIQGIATLLALIFWIAAPFVN